jgi:outer membrane lipoprotein-sorting protein
MERVSMKTKRIALALAMLVCASVVSAQTVDEVIEKHLTALGGRPALGKVKSRQMTGEIVLSTPAGEISGTIEVLNAAPNKTRTVIKADLSALGAGQLVVDQRFDGQTGYILDSLQGNRAMSGGQLDLARNSAFPNQLLNYKELGIAAKLDGTQKVGDRDAYVLVLEPTSGPVVRQFIDAENYLLVKSVVKVDVPQLGQEVEQATEFSDYRDVDGVKLPFKARATSAVQNYTITVTKIEHNVPVDDKLFVKP